MKDAEISEKRALLRASLASGKPLARQDVDEQVQKDYAYDESRKDMSKEEAMDLDDEVCFPPCNDLDLNPPALPAKISADSFIFKSNTRD